MPVPAAAGLEFREQRIANALQQYREHRQRQTLARLAVGRGGESQAGQTRQVCASCVAMQNLQKKNMHRGHWIEDARPPDVPKTSTNFQNDVAGQYLGYIGLEMRDDFGDSVSHPWPPIERE